MGMQRAPFLFSACIQASECIFAQLTFRGPTFSESEN